MEKINKNKIFKIPQLPARQASLAMASEPLSGGLDLIVNFFKRGKVVVYPTDTIYGLGCIVTSKKAINKIYKIKKREKGKSLLVLVSGLAMAKKYCRINKEQEEYLKGVWTLTRKIKGGDNKAVTVILRSKGILPKELNGGADSIAVRLPKNKFLVDLIKKVKYPIVSTSANISGWKYDGDPEKIKKIFRNKIDLFVDMGKLKNKPSRILDITDVKNIRAIRK